MSFGWRSNPNYPGIEISSGGYIRSYLKSGPGDSLREVPVLLNPTPDKDGYLRVSVKCSDGKRRRKGIHQLVAENHLSYLRFDGAIVLHGLNGMLDNSVQNIRWGTNAENTSDRGRDGTLGLTRTVEEIEEIKRLYTMGFTQREIARVFKTTQSYVHELVSGKKRKDVA